MNFRRYSYIFHSAFIRKFSLCLTNGENIMLSKAKVLYKKFAPWILGAGIVYLAYKNKETIISKLPIKTA